MRLEMYRAEEKRESGTRRYSCYRLIVRHEGRVIRWKYATLQRNLRDEGS